MKQAYEFLIQLHESHSFITDNTHRGKWRRSPSLTRRTIFHYVAMCGDYRFLRIVINALPKKQDMPMVNHARRRQS